MNEQQKNALADAFLIEEFLQRKAFEQDAPPPYNPETQDYLKKCKICNKIVDQYSVVCSICVTRHLFRCDQCYNYYQKSECHREELGGDTDDVCYYCNECWKYKQ
jgi:hypothetical protein